MKNIDYDENDNRIRTADVCATHGEYWGCLAKRLDDDGQTAWGVPGVQHLSKASRGANR